MMTVEELIVHLMQVKDKSKQIEMVYNTGTDFSNIPFLEEGILCTVREDKSVVELIDD